MHPFENYPHGGDEPLGPTRDVDDVAVYTDHSCAFCGLRIDKSNPGLATGVLHYVVARKQRSIQWAAGFQSFFDDKINAVAACQRCHGYINGGALHTTEIKPHEYPASFGQLLAVRDRMYFAQRRAVQRSNG